jgi:hypothetical protein
MIKPRSSGGGSWTPSISKSSNRVAPRSHASSACFRLKRPGHMNECRMRFRVSPGRETRRGKNTYAIPRQLVAREAARVRLGETRDCRGSRFCKLFTRPRPAIKRRFPDQPAPAVVGELAGCFLRSCSDYAPLRLFLGPGEGFRLPRGGLILDGYPEGKREPDVLLSITDGARQNI